MKDWFLTIGLQVGSRIARKVYERTLDFLCAGRRNRRRQEEAEKRRQDECPEAPDCQNHLPIVSHRTPLSGLSATERAHARAAMLASDSPRVIRKFKPTSKGSKGKNRGKHQPNAKRSSRPQ